jgi:hypothetical protein
MHVVAEPRAVDVRSRHQFEEEIGAASSENGLFIAKMGFSVWTGPDWKSFGSGSSTGDTPRHALRLVGAGATTPDKVSKV